LIRRDHRLELSESTRRNDAARARVATVLTDAVQALVSNCTAAVVAVDYGAEWQLLAQRGPLDVSSCWRQLVARHDRDGDHVADPRAPVVVEIPFAGVRAMLVVVPVGGSTLPSGLREIVRPLLEAGEILLGAAGSAPPSERSLRLVEGSRLSDATG
jgi:hypothetical protein